MRYYVDCTTEKTGNGTLDAPFKTINEAAALAKPGDSVIVSPGIYREWVNPQNSGTEEQRIAYISTERHKAIITGAERITEWEQVCENVYKAEIPVSFFPEENPFEREIFGDWYTGKPGENHTADVFLNDRSMYEVSSLDRVKKPVISAEAWHPEESLLCWFSEKKEDRTVIYANFQGKDPNKENVEITVREKCFYPEKEGIGYISLIGFTVCKAATQWAPPTAYQVGMIGPHWSKGWIIEDCDVYESKCVGISLGKYLQSSSDNKWSKWPYKDGTQTERDCICQAANEGWSKETVGSHRIRKCRIHDCGQAGIAGHMGGVFSTIEDNEICDINIKRNLTGHEIGGIKLHAAIDTVISHNHIHHCTRGIWLDWQAQGTRVTKNLLHDNTIPWLKKDQALSPMILATGCLGEDLFIEVSHGPTMVDHNIFLSERAIKLCAQGVAITNNLIAGGFTAVGLGTNNGTRKNASPRYTPYHVPHGVLVAGFMTILHGDNRIYNNIFIEPELKKGLKKLQKLGGMTTRIPGMDWDDFNMKAGTFPFSVYPTVSEWERKFDGPRPDVERYYSHLPVSTGGNVFFNGAKPSAKETDSLVIKEKVTCTLEKKDNGYALHTDLFSYIKDFRGQEVTTENLGVAFEPEQRFEDKDGNPYDLTTDIFMTEAASNAYPGPIADPSIINNAVYSV